MADDQVYDKPVVRTWGEAARLSLYGICIGCADVFPGISGGAVAFVLGIYEDLINSIRSFNVSAFRHLFTGHFSRFSQVVAWEFLLSLLVGVGITFLVLPHVVQKVLYHEVYRTYLYAGFMGLLTAAIYVCTQRVKQWRSQNMLLLALGIVIAFFVSGLKPPQSTQGTSYDVPISDVILNGHEATNYDPSRKLLKDVPEPTLSAMISKGILDPTTHVYSQMTKREGPASEFVGSHQSWQINWWLFVCGIIAISAMLSGISGTYLLSLLGVYPIAIGAIADLTGGLWHGAFDVEAFMVVVSMGLGVLCGAAAFSRIVHWLLENYHDATISTLIGLMLGGLRALWPFWSYEYVLLPLKLQSGPQLRIVDPIMPHLDSPHVWIAIACALAGFGVIWVLWKAKH